MAPARADGRSTTARITASSPIATDAMTEARSATGCWAMAEATAAMTAVVPDTRSEIHGMRNAPAAAAHRPMGSARVDGPAVSEVTNPAAPNARARMGDSVVTRRFKLIDPGAPVYEPVVHMRSSAGLRAPPTTTLSRYQPRAPGHTRSTRGMACLAG